MDPTQPTNGNAPPPGVIRMMIDLDQATQSVTVHGPIQNRMLCYAILKMAEKSVDEAFAQMRKEQRIVAARVGDLRR